MYWQPRFRLCRIKSQIFDVKNKLPMASKQCFRFKNQLKVGRRRVIQNNIESRPKDWNF